MNAQCGQIFLEIAFKKFIIQACGLKAQKKTHYSLRLFSVGARLKQRLVGTNVNLFSSLLAPNTY